MSANLISSEPQGGGGNQVKEIGSGSKHGGRSGFGTGAENAARMEAEASGLDVGTVDEEDGDEKNSSVVVPVDTAIHKGTAFPGTLSGLARGERSWVQACKKRGG